MKSRQYLYQVVEDLRKRDNATKDAEDSFLMSIYDHIRDLPSPEREELFVDLIVECDGLASGRALIERRKTSLAA